MSIQRLTTTIEECEPAELDYGTIRTLGVIRHEADKQDKQIADLKAQLDAANELLEAQAICAEEFATMSAENAKLKTQLDRDRLIKVINDTVDKQQCLGAVDIADAILTIKEGDNATD